MPRQYVLGAGPVEAPVAELPARLCPAPLTAAASSLRTPPIAASRVASIPCVGVDLRSAIHVHSDVRRATRVNVPVSPFFYSADLARQQRKSPGSGAGAMLEFVCHGITVTIGRQWTPAFSTTAGLLKIRSQNACSAGFQDRLSGSIHPSDHETCVITHLKRRLSRESWLIAVQPISFMSRSISVCMRRSARSTPAWPAAAKGYR
jgi:hypothetical protein